MSAHLGGRLVFGCVLLFAVSTAPAGPGSQSAPATPLHRADLQQVAADLRALRLPPTRDGLPDYSAGAVEAQKQGLQALRARFDALQPSTWPVHDRVDYLLVRAELDQLEYALHVHRPTSRNPNFYLSSISSAGMLSGPTLSRLGQLVSQPAPFDATRARRILDHLRAIPRILEQAKHNLTEPDAHMAQWALPTLERARESSRRFADALVPLWPAAEAAELPAAAQAMGEALAEYEQWIRDRLDTTSRSAPVGREMYDWLLHHVWLLPYDAGDILRLGEQEYARFQAWSAFEEVRNQGQLPLTRAATTAEYARRTEEEEKAIRAFLQKTGVLTVPAGVGPYRRALMPPYLQAFTLWNGLSGYGTPDRGAVKYAVPETDPYAETYWEAIMRTDPSTNIFHDGIPGHHFQGILARLNPCPIRQQHTERFKSEGWATYWEEAAVRLGYYDQRPRSRELILSYLRLRAARVIVDVRMALGQMTRDEAVRALMEVPVDRRIATEEVDDFLAAPTGGVVYLIGKLQIERLLAERRAQLGSRFVLREYHDGLMDAGWVPLALTRWELTGADDEVNAMFADRARVPRPGQR